MQKRGFESRHSPDPAAADDDEDHDDDEDGRQGVRRLRVVQHVSAEHRNSKQPQLQPEIKKERSGINFNSVMPRRHSSVGRVSFKGPGLVQLY